MKIAVVVSSKNRPHWLRLFLLQMANQTVRPDIVVVYENGQARSMKEIFSDIPIKVDFLFSSNNLASPDFAIPPLRKTLEHNPDVIFQMSDDNVYFATHIEKVLEGFKGGFDVSYLSHGNLLNVNGGKAEYYTDIDWKMFCGNLGVDDGFALTNKAARQYLAYLEFASNRCKEKDWGEGKGGMSSHHSDGVRFAYRLHSEKKEYNFLRNVNFIQSGTMAWIHHGENFSTSTNSLHDLLANLKCVRLWESGRV